MSKSKELYYTPIIEEFRVGFEYESRHGKVTFDKEKVIKREVLGWMPLSVNEESELSLYAKSIERKAIRVKFLDEKDIKSFEFGDLQSNDEESTLDSWWRYTYHSGDFTIYVRHGSWYEFPNSDKGHWIRISKKGSTGLVFSGWLKNRSELSVILKQIGYEQK